MAYVTQFDSKSKEFSVDSNFNYAFILAQGRYFNDRLKLKGHVFLNEVLDTLGLPRTREGQLDGWTSDYVIVIQIEENVWNSHLTLTFNTRSNILDDVFS